MEADKKLLENVITGDESWLFQYDLKTKRQSRQWKSVSLPRPKKARMQRSQVKVMLIIFFDHQEMVHHEFVPQGPTVNQRFYKVVLTRLINKIRQKRRASWSRKTWILHHDNDPAHIALSIKQFLVSKEITTLHHPSYSPDSSRCDFFFFSKTERDSQGDTLPRSRGYQNQRDETPQNHHKFLQCFKAWSKRMEKCIKANGEYFEGDK